MRDLEDYINELKEKNKKLKAELKVSKKSKSRSMKGDICNANNWTGEEVTWPIRSLNFARIICFLITSS